jgi:hypothetical protein
MNEEGEFRSYARPGHHALIIRLWKEERDVPT